MKKLFEMIMSPNDDGSGGSGSPGAPAPQTQPPEGGAPSPDGGTPQFVPYERFQEVNTKFRDIEQKYGQLQQTLDEINKRNQPDPDKEFASKFYQDPANVMKQYIADQIKALKEEGNKRDSEMKRNRALEWFKQQEGYTPEMDEKAARFIIENGLQGVDPEKAVRLAHKFLTMGDGSGYVRQTKEALKKPGSGGKPQEKSPLEELRELDPRDPEYENKAKAIHAKLTAGK